MENKIYLIIGVSSALIGAYGSHLYYQSEIADYLLKKEQEYSHQLELKIEENKKLQAVVNEIEWELLEQKDSYEKNLADLRSRYSIDGLFDCSRSGECLPRTEGSTSEFVCYRTSDLRKRINQSVALGKKADDLAMKYNALLKVCK